MGAGDDIAALNNYKTSGLEFGQRSPVRLHSTDHHDTKARVL